MANPTKVVRFISKAKKLKALSGPVVKLEWEGVIYEFPPGTTKEEGVRIIWNRVLAPKMKGDVENVVLSESDNLVSNVAARQEELTKEVAKMSAYQTRKADIVEDFMEKGMILVTDNIYYDRKMDQFWQITPDLTFVRAFGGRGKAALEESGDAFLEVLKSDGDDYFLFQKRLSAEEELNELNKVRKEMKSNPIPDDTELPPKPPKP